MRRTPKKVLILGGLGNGSVIAAALQNAANSGQRDWIMTGYLNDCLRAGEMIEGYPVLGPLKDVSRFLSEDYYFVNTIYRIDGQDRRIALFESLQIPDDRLATFLHPQAYVADNVRLGPGCVIMPNASVSPGVKFGRCCLVMAGAVIGHNCEIGNYCHFAAQSCLGAYSKVGDGVHIGINASVREKLTSKRCSALAMGAVLLNDMGEYEIWAGVPAKKLRNAEREL